jgi:hydroxymethylbilane synthase
MMERIRIATRESRLALWQAHHVADRLRERYPGLKTELVPMTTRGDQILHTTLAKIGGKGLFIKELEAALLEDRADIAVHSMKDVPAEMPEGLGIVSVLERADPRDAFVSSRYGTLAELPPGAVVGTSSLRRQAQIRHARPDLEIRPVRGNVETRLRKLDEGDYDAILLACAGLERLGLGDRITDRIDLETSLPAVGQAIVGIECGTGAADLVALLLGIQDTVSRQAVDAERAFAARLEGSCESPIAGHAVVAGDTLRLRGLVAAADGSEVLADEISGSAGDGQALGRTLADRLLARGAGPLLASGAAS